MDAMDPHQVRDPVCNKRIELGRAVASEEHDGVAFHFCSPACHQAFLEDPHRYGHAH